MKRKVLLELVKIAEETRLGRIVRRYSVRVGGRELETVIAREPLLITAEKAPWYIDGLKGTGDAVAKSDALRLYDRLLIQHPAVTRGVNEYSFARIVQEAEGRGAQLHESLRGLMVEKRLLDIPQTKEAWSALDKVRLAKVKKFKIEWGQPDVVVDVVDGQRAPLGDLHLISRCKMIPAGRSKPQPFAWFMAIVESKSFNVGELANVRKREVGQHVWDWARLKSRGAYIEGVYYPPENIMCDPLPRDAWGSKKTVVAFKDAATREAELTKLPGYYTQFIAFAPESLSENQILKIASQGIQIELWPWPFTVQEADRFCEALVKILDKGR